jgi:hypothetical protein
MVSLRLRAEESMLEFAPDLGSSLTSWPDRLGPHTMVIMASEHCVHPSVDEQLPRAFPALAIFLTEFVGR